MGKVRVLERGESTECVAVLEELLAQAREGKILAVAIAAVSDSGGIERRTAGEGTVVSLATLVGGVHTLLHWMTQKMLNLGG